MKVGQAIILKELAKGLLDEVVGGLAGKFLGAFSLELFAKE
jgi:hypothetical protein